MLIKLAY